MPGTWELLAFWLRALAHAVRVAQCYCRPAYRTHALISRLARLQETAESATGGAGEGARPRGLRRGECREVQYACCYWLALLASLGVERVLRAFFWFVPGLDLLLFAYFLWLAAPDWENARFMYYGLLGPLAKRLDARLETGGLGRVLGLGRLQDNLANGARDLAERAQGFAPRVSGPGGFTSLPV